MKKNFSLKLFLNFKSAMVLALVSVAILFSSEATAQSPTLGSTPIFGDRDLTQTVAQTTFVDSNTAVGILAAEVNAISSGSTNMSEVDMNIYPLYYKAVASHLSSGSVSVQNALQLALPVIKERLNDFSPSTRPDVETIVLNTVNLLD